MSAQLSPLAGKPAPLAVLADIPRLITAYYSELTDTADPAQRVAFGTSGHRGTALNGSFNEAHILAISQAVCAYRSTHHTSGPLFLGFDTHALSAPAFATCLEVLAANGVDVCIANGDEYTPTPAISHAILRHNQRRTDHFADGIVITPSHNPPDSGGLKYNTPNGGPADTQATAWIEAEANRLLQTGLRDVRRVGLAAARRAPTTHAHDFLAAYVADLGNVLDLDVIRDSRLRMGVDPLGGAGVHYWARIAEHYQLDLTVVNSVVDPTFRFMSVDWDGKIRMDPSSPYAMQSLLELKDRFDIAFACDTDHDRHGIVTASAGLLPPNHFLATAIDYLLKHRTEWPPAARIGKTVVSSGMIDRVTAGFGRSLYEVPVGFKWYADGLLNGSLCFGGEESAGASFSRRDGTVWSTDKDGITLALLAAEITARTGRDPAVRYQALTREFGDSFADRVEAPIGAASKPKLARLAASQLRSTALGGEPIQSVLNRAPGNDAPIGGIKVSTANGWFAARPSGTEDIYKIYGESWRSEEHLRAILREAQSIVDAALASA